MALPMILDNPNNHKHTCEPNTDSKQLKSGERTQLGLEGAFTFHSILLTFLLSEHSIPRVIGCTEN
jgi:hypothetical protein